jgi:hypothetical protein
VRNAKDELNKVISGRYSNVKCASIKHGPDFGDVTQAQIELKEGYSDAELDAFLDSLDFEYENGYGCQELFGTVWLNDGTWLERGEYDGSEWWEHRVCPEIPETLKMKQQLELDM